MARLACVLAALTLISSSLPAQSVAVLATSDRLGDIVEVVDVEQGDAELLFANAEAAVYFPDLRRVRMLGRDKGPGRGTERATFEDFNAGLERDFPRFRSNRFGSYLLKTPVRTTALPATSTLEGLHASPQASLLTDGFESSLSQWQVANNANGDYNFTTMGCKTHGGSWSADTIRGGYKGQYLTCADSYPAGVTTQITHNTCDAIAGAGEAWLDFYFTADMDDSEVLGVYYVASDGFIYGYGFQGSWSGWFHVVANLKQWNHIGDLTAQACPKLIFQFRSDAAAPAGTGAWIDDVTIRNDAPSFLRCSIAATPSSGAAPLTVSFAPTVSGATGAETYTWQFGDAASSSSTTRNATFTYAAAGEYWARLRVSDSTGTRAYAHTKIVVTSGTACTLACSASAAATATTGSAVSFTATASASSCSGTPAFAWSFGDGQTSALQNPSHAYASAGTYSWSMTASVAGTSCVKSGTITVSSSSSGQPKKRAVRPPTAGAGTEILVQPSGSDQTFTAGEVSVTIPGGLLTTAQSLKVTKRTGVPPANNKALQLGGAYEITLGNLDRFAKPLIVKLRYDATAVRTDIAIERALSAAYYDTQRGSWIEVPSKVDKSRQEIAVGANHLTMWGWFMWGRGYPVIESSLFTIVYDPAEMNDPLLGPVYNAPDKSNHVDANVPDYVEDTVAYLGIAYQRYKAAGFKEPAKPINVYVGGSDASQRAKFFGHGLTISLNSMTQQQLKMDTAHELFHSFEGAYLTAVGMGTGEIPGIGWAPPVLSWSVWYVEAAAEYAAEHVAWDGTLNQMGNKLRRDYLSYPISDVSANHDYGYATAHFLKFLVDKGANFKAMSEYLFNYDWLNANDYYYPMHEYLEKTLGSGQGLPRQYQAFARTFTFDANGPMPAIADSLHTEVAAHKTALTSGGDSATVTLPGWYTAKLWGIRFSEAMFSDTKPKLKYAVGVSGSLPAKIEVDVYILKGDRRVAGGGTPVGTITQATKSVQFEVEKGDAVYVLPVSTDSATQQLKLAIAPVTAFSAYSVKVRQVTSCGDGNSRDWGTWGMFEGLKWSGNSFSYSETTNDTFGGGILSTNELTVTGALSADRRTVTTMSIEIHGKELYPPGCGSGSGNCTYEVWKSIELANVPAASDWSTSFLHYESKGAGARPKITKFVNRVLTTGFPRDNFDCTYPIDETQLEMIEVVVLLN